MKKETKYTTENHRFSNLEKFQSIDVEGDWSVLKNRMNFQNNRTISTVWRIAAIAILLLGVGFIAKRYVLNPPELIIAMAAEEQKELLLPDGSHVFLNRNSQLIYPGKFRKNNRQVSLTGEGFFEVARNPAKPFRVNVADRANVEVLGTSFNIHAPAESSTVNVQVVEGRVAFYAPGKVRAGKILEKDDQAQMQNGIIEMNTRRNTNFLSWKTGILRFDQQAIEQVIDVLGIHYNREIVLDPSVDTQLTFTSVIENQELESVLEELSLVLGISYGLQEHKVMIYMPE